MEFLDKREGLFLSVACGLEISCEPFLQKGEYCSTLPDGSIHGKYYRKNKGGSETVEFRYGKAHGEYIFTGMNCDYGPYGDFTRGKLRGDCTLSGNYIDGDREGEFLFLGKRRSVTFVYEDDKLVRLADETHELLLDWNEEKMCCTLSKGEKSWVRTYSAIPNKPNFLSDYDGYAEFQEPPCLSDVVYKLDTHKKGEIYWEFIF
ncbi:hypothetical protein D1R32_gp052 [Tunisvirus fontaine2]|uniref:Uncharacterized protein n=1 Tax=Tunisvirus fontaine2 TaxID=1421067 RepID=V9SFV8_9VIRU|nr:hypothetical protein D1R32_gp052 [Tunisvirus fontaine2]AHC54769.1 hypothetical protein TNS_ORF51 [Tunisvirus fontaine2]